MSNPQFIHRAYVENGTLFVLSVNNVMAIYKDNIEDRIKELQEKSKKLNINFEVSYGFNE